MKLYLSALVAAAALGAGCNTTAKVIAMPGVDVIAEYSRSDYVVLGDAEGKACVEETCFLGVFCSTKSDTGATERQEGRLSRDVQTSAPGLSIPGFSGSAGTEGNTSAAEEAAMYKAMQSVPDADALLAPRKSMEVTTTANPIAPSVKACVRVFGKGMRLKTDAEVAAGKGAAAPAASTTTTPPPPPPPPPPAETPAPATP